MRKHNGIDLTEYAPARPEPIDVRDQRDMERKLTGWLRARGLAPETGFRARNTIYPKRSK